MSRFHLKYLYVTLVGLVSAFSVLTAEQTTEIRNNKRSMANDEVTVFAAGESRPGTNTSWRGGLGVNFPSGSPVRLLIAQRPAMERIQPGEKIVTTAATTSSGGYNKAPATTDGKANSLAFGAATCTLVPAGLMYNMNFSATLDSSNIDIQNFPTNYSIQQRYNFMSAPSGSWASGVTNESMQVSCTGATASFPMTCYMQARIRYYNGSEEAILSTVGKICTHTSATSGPTYSDY
jgi:hypothetical protein